MARRSESIEIKRKIYRIPTKKGYTKTRLDKTRTWAETYGKGKCVLCKKHFKESELYTFFGNRSDKFQHVDCKHPTKIE